MSVLGKRGAPPPYSMEPPPKAGEAPIKAVLKMVVGVDFGTTGTGVSYVTTEGAHVKTLDDVHSVDDWPNPGRVGDFTCKTPSRLAYAEENERITVNAYGHEVKPEDKSYSWMKLTLDPEQASKYDDPSLSASEGLGVLKLPVGKKPVDLCGDYLTEVTKLAYKSIAKKVSVETLRSMPVEFWFTVPAVWSDKAKADTLRAARIAAKQAKIKLHRDSQIFLIREPEAAAIATLSSSIQGRSESQIKVGDSVLVADCGGGTVDTTSYVITSISPLEFKELIVGTGGKCGSTFIDRNLHAFMENKFGTAYTSLPWQKRGPASRFMKEFEGHKRDFGKSNDPTTYYELQLVMKRVKTSKHYDSDENIVKIYQDDMKKMFDPVVQMIIALLDSQLKTERRQSGKVTIKTLLLVGGFGDSTYLMDVLRAWCAQHGIRPICPKDPQSAIVRGAALSGVLKIQPSSRRSRFHYGWDFHEAWDRTRHRVEDRFLWDWDNTYRARNQMRWELEKGDIVDQNTHIRFEFEFTIAENDIRGSNNCDLYSCAYDEAPVNARDAGVKKIATISLDFSNIDLRSRPHKMVKRKRKYTIPCEVVIQFGHRRGVLTFSCSVDGKEIGQTELDFDGASNVDAAEGVGIGGGAYAPTCTPQ